MPFPWALLYGKHPRSFERFVVATPAQSRRLGKSQGQSTKMKQLDVDVSPPDFFFINLTVMKRASWYMPVPNFMTLATIPSSYYWTSTHIQ